MPIDNELRNRTSVEKDLHKQVVFHRPCHSKFYKETNHTFPRNLTVFVIFIYVLDLKTFVLQIMSIGFKLSKMLLHLLFYFCWLVTI